MPSVRPCKPPLTRPAVRNNFEWSQASGQSRTFQHSGFCGHASLSLSRSRIFISIFLPCSTDD